jgi:hypothetical protein
MPVAARDASCLSGQVLLRVMLRVMLLPSRARRERSRAPLCVSLHARGQVDARA